MSARSDAERVRRLEGELELVAAQVDQIVTAVEQLRCAITSLALTQGELEQMLRTVNQLVGLWRADLIEGR